MIFNNDGYENDYPTQEEIDEMFGDNEQTEAEMIQELVDRR